VKIGEDVTEGCFCQRLYSNCTANTLPRKFHRGWRFQKRRASNCSVKFAHYRMLMAKEQKVLQSVIGRLIETGRCYGRNINV